MTCDLALVYDAARRRCDLVYDGRDFVLDSTPATPMLVALLADRRARPDDKLPDPEGDRFAPRSLIARRGWCGDALDPQQRRTGSRLWLLRQAKRTEQTRRRAEDMAAEALAEVESARGIAIELEVVWAAAPPGTLAIRASAGGATVAGAIAITGSGAVAGTGSGAGAVTGWVTWLAAQQKLAGGGILAGGGGGAVAWGAGRGIAVAGGVIANTGVLSLGSAAGDIALGPGLTIAGGGTPALALSSGTAAIGRVLAADGAGGVAWNASTGGVVLAQGSTVTATGTVTLTSAFVITGSTLDIATAVPPFGLLAANSSGLYAPVLSGLTLNAGGTLSVTGSTTLAAPGTSTLGGVFAATATGGQFVTGISTSGALTFATPATGGTTITNGGTAAATLALGTGLSVSTGTLNAAGGLSAIAAHTLLANFGTVSAVPSATAVGNGLTLTAAGTLALSGSSYLPAAVAITGGAVDGVVIGATTAAGGSFTSLSTSGTVSVSGTLSVGAGAAFTTFPTSLLAISGSGTIALSGSSSLVSCAGTLSISAAGTLSLASGASLVLPSQTKRFALAAPSAAAGAPTFRQLLHADCSGADLTCAAAGKYASRWYRPPGQISSGVALVVGRLYAVPFWLAQDTTVHYLGAGLQVVSPAAGHINIGIYADPGQADDALLGSVNVAIANAQATGSFSGQVNGVPGVAIPAGLMWLAIQADTAYTVYGYNTGADQALLSVLFGFTSQAAAVSNTSAAGCCSIYSATNTSYSGTMPSTFGTVSFNDGSQAPMVMFKT